VAPIGPPSLESGHQPKERTAVSARSAEGSMQDQTPEASFDIRCPRSIGGRWASPTWSQGVRFRPEEACLRREQAPCFFFARGQEHRPFSVEPSKSGRRESRDIVLVSSETLARETNSGQLARQLCRGTQTRERWPPTPGNNRRLRWRRSSWLHTGSLSGCPTRSSPPRPPRHLMVDSTSARSPADLLPARCLHVACCRRSPSPGLDGDDGTSWRDRTENRRRERGQPIVKHTVRLAAPRRYVSEPTSRAGDAPLGVFCFRR